MGPVTSTTESRSRKEATKVPIAGPPVKLALEVLRECRCEDDRDGTRADADRPLVNFPFSTLSRIISSSIFDISSTVFFFLSTGFCGESSVIGLVVKGDRGPFEPC
jgi:hypothetical protein